MQAALRAAGAEVTRVVSTGFVLWSSRPSCPVCPSCVCQPSWTCPDCVCAAGGRVVAQELQCASGISAFALGVFVGVVLTLALALEVHRRSKNGSSTWSPAPAPRARAISGASGGGVGIRVVRRGRSALVASASEDGEL